MTHPWLMVAGCAIAGWLAIEFIAKPGVRVPLQMNVLGAIAGALIAGAFV